MPIATRENLAIKLRQNWLTKHPGDLATAASGLDDSLTSLSWLQNLNIMTITTPTPPASPEPFADAQLMSSYSAASQVDPNAVLHVRVKQEPGMAAANLLKMTNGQHHSLVAVTSAGGGLDVGSSVGGVIGAFDQIDYKNNPYVKPPYSYATLICMAMRETKTNKITLSGIYNWITENFVYYRNADPSWQNSIRHNLSLNKCFQKVARRKDEPGKGGFWKINPEYSDMFVNGIFKKRRGSLSGRDAFLPTSTSTLPPAAKRCRTDDSASPRALRADTIFHMGADSISDVLDISWNTTTLLSRDIDVGGVRVKTEDIIDEKENVVAVGTITPLSPPTSDGDTDVGLDDLLGAGLDFDDPLDLSTGSPLDLTVQGTGIRPPDWWSDSGRDMFAGMLSPRQLNHNSGLNTPIPASPVLDSDVELGHPWAEDRLELDQALASFGDMFELESIEALSSSEHS